MDPDDQQWTVRLPQTGAKWRAGGSDEEIEETLSDELHANAWELTAEAWTENEQIEILEMRFHDEHAALDVKVRASFTQLQESGCKDYPRKTDRAVEFLLTMQRADNEALIEHSASNPDQWDIEDRNSAYDGT